MPVVLSPRWLAQPPGLRALRSDLQDGFLWSAPAPDYAYQAGRWLRGTNNTTTQTVGPAGLARRWTGTGGGTVGVTFTSPLLPASNAFTLLVLAAPVASTTPRSLWSQKPSGFFVQQMVWSVNAADGIPTTGESGSLTLYHRDNNAFSGSIRATGQVDGRLHCWGLGSSSSPGTSVLYRDGVPQALASNTPALGGSYSDPTMPATVGNWSNAAGDAQFVDPLFFVAGWPRRLADAQLRRLTEDPWSVLAPPARRLWAAAAVAGGSSGAAGLSTETDTALTLGAARPVGLAAETDTALAAAGTQIRAAGLASEAGAAIAPSGLQLRAAGLAGEADSAVALAGVNGSAAGAAAESDSALTLASARPAGIAATADAALPLNGTQTRAAGLAAEAGSAFGLGGLQAIIAGVALETDSALTLTSSGVGFASEADTAVALLPVSAVVAGSFGGRRRIVAEPVAAPTLAARVVWRAQSVRPVIGVTSVQHVAAAAKAASLSAAEQAPLRVVPPAASGATVEQQSLRPAQIEAMLSALSAMLDQVLATVPADQRAALPPDRVRALVLARFAPAYPPARLIRSKPKAAA